MGPMAQDFYGAFGLGNTDKAIFHMNAIGVRLASIQGFEWLAEESGGPHCPQRGKATRECAHYRTTRRGRTMNFDGLFKKFDVGHKDTEVDKNGILMVAIQTLHNKLRAREEILREQETRIKDAAADDRPPVAIVKKAALPRGGIVFVL
uniref:Uncharacterized protein n=1 Tax=Candidatus Kentrum sp. TC TaxID=2126339 RepID=A0A450YEW5_9GAMM|nr:MAG: hypothetical protein BECKTC1821E_GA0114239_100673 [Candidatus Kentron sp. TC]